MARIYADTGFHVGELCTRPFEPSAVNDTRPRCTRTHSRRVTPLRLRFRPVFATLDA